jgi:hypothetical protein
MIEGGQLGSKGSLSSPGQAVGAAPFAFGHRLDESFGFEPGNCSVKGPGTWPGASQPLDFLDQGVPVFGAIGQANHDQQPDF